MHNASVSNLYGLGIAGELLLHLNIAHFPEKKNHHTTFCIANWQS